MKLFHACAIPSALITAACTRGAIAPSTDFTLDSSVTLLTGEGARLGRPGEIALDGSGNLYITDAAASSIVVLDSGGRAIAAIGRNGAGPGEFNRPRSLTVTGDTLWVADPENGRFQVLSTSGVFVRSFPSPTQALSGAVAFAADGSSLVALNGVDSALVQRVSPMGNAGRRFGRPIVPTTGYWDFVAIKRDIADGQVPPVFRNIVHPVPGDSGAVWVLLDGEGVVRRYNGADSLVWERRLEEPELKAIREGFFARNRADRDPSRVFPLSYFHAGEVVGDNLWILFGGSDTSSALFVVMEPHGAIRARIRAPGVSGADAFAVDVGRRLLYVISSQDATLIRLPLPLSIPLGLP